MGSGASFDNGLNLGSTNGDNRYFCHSCHRVFGLGTINNPTDFYCPHCQSTFLEEMGGDAGFYNRSSELVAVRHRNQSSVMTVEQARRMNNATAMLRLLESQLREELEHLQRAVGTFTMNNDNSEKPKKLTKVMRGRLRNTTVNLDLICGQPSCPICNEEFILGGDALKIPCSHIFHKDCVLPWLEMKQTCPICRAELNGDLPTKEEIGNFTTDELTDRLNEADVVVLSAAAKSKTELVDLLHEKWSELYQNDNDETEQQVVTTRNHSHHMMPMSINAVMNASTMTNRAGHNFNLILQAPTDLDLHDNDDDDDDDDDNNNNSINMIMSEYSLPASRRVPGRLFNNDHQQQPRLMDSSSFMEMSRSERSMTSTATASAADSSSNDHHLRRSFADAIEAQAPRWPNTTTFQIVPSTNGGQQQFSIVARSQQQPPNHNNDTRDNNDSET